MADAAAIMTMMDTINHAMDCMLSFQSLLMMSQSMTFAQALPETPPQVLSLTSPQSFQSLATTHLNHDVKLPLAIHSTLFLKFLHNRGAQSCRCRFRFRCGSRERSRKVLSIAVNLGLCNQFHRTSALQDH